MEWNQIQSNTNQDLKNHKDWFIKKNLHIFYIFNVKAKKYKLFNHSSKRNDLALNLEP